jgi:hypothetical protein
LVMTKHREKPIASHCIWSLEWDILLHDAGQD